jgi:aromatic ring-opening dioxygenase catalytic subunit (LigB family)
MINANRDTDAETWSALRDQLDKAREGLFIVSAGNPCRRVRKLAQEAEVKLTNAGTWSRWAAKDLLEHRDFTESMKMAYKHHAEATAAMRELIGANFRWSPLPPRPAAAQWTDTLAAPPAPPRGVGSRQWRR